MVHVPEAHRWATRVNDYLRNHSSVSKKGQELAMLVTARARPFPPQSARRARHTWVVHPDRMPPSLWRRHTQPRSLT